MSAAPFRIEGFDARSWHRLITLVAPGLTSYAPASNERGARTTGGFLFVLYDDDGVVSALHSLRGAVTLDAWGGPASLEACADALGSRFGLAARVGAIEALYEQLGARLQHDDDPWELVLLAASAVRELMDHGVMHLVPASRTPVPLPPMEFVRAAWDHVLPDGHAFALVLFDGIDVETALVARRRGAGLDLCLGPESLRRMVGPLAGDLRHDFRAVRTAIEREVAPLSCGVFMATDTLRALLLSDASGDWARAIARREAVIAPMPPWVAMAAGAGALRHAASRSRRVVAGIDFADLLGPIARRAQELLDGVDLRAMLGFDPLELLGALLRQSRSANTPDDTRKEP
jgi:hypothetical protein